MGNPAIMSGLQKTAKCESVRTTSKNHHSTTTSVLNVAVNNTIGSLAASAMSKGGAPGQQTLNIREARTKPTSPDRSLLMINNSYNQPSKKSINNT